MKPLKINIEQIDSVLPQTQCGDCTYDGCLPYAQAMQEGSASLDLCLPGGVKVLKQLGELFQQDIEAFIPEMETKQKPKRLAKVREEECIGCTKCIQACPVDAIFGASKKMHTVLLSECTGCALCVEPCPMDCIDMVDTEDQTYQSDHARIRYQNRNQRLAKAEAKAKLDYQQKKQDAKKAAIAAAIARSKAKKSS